MKIILTLRIEESIREELSKLAKKDNRSLSNYIETVLIKYIDNKKYI